MCGISGMFGHRDGALVDAMLQSIRHRGPDDMYTVVGEDYALGAARLAIVDVEHGRQPLSNEDETIWACQNGELYNLPELRPRLEARGHRFRTRCDTELLPHLYEEHGIDLPAHVHGMFAAAVWDTRGRTGLLTRDRMGKKPLYYMERGRVLYFASELKALLLVPGFERTHSAEISRLCMLEGFAGHAEQANIRVRRYGGRNIPYATAAE